MHGGQYFFKHHITEYFDQFLAFFNFLFFDLHPIFSRNSIGSQKGYKFRFKLFQFLPRQYPIFHHAFFITKLNKSIQKFQLLMCYICIDVCSLIKLKNMIELLFGITLPDFSHPEIWMSILTLTFLEIVLGVDNILFISIISGKLPKEKQSKAINIGLILAMAMRIILLFGISYLTAMESTWFSFDIGWLSAEVSGQSVILFAGGIFLLYKATSEIHHKLEGDPAHAAGQRVTSFGNAIVQIAVINLVFSID